MRIPHGITGWGYFYSLFFTLLLFWCFAWTLLSFPLPVLSLSALHRHSSSFGDQRTVLQTDGRFQPSPEQDTALSGSVPRRVPVTFSTTLIRFAWWTRWQIERKKLHIFSILFGGANDGHQLLIQAASFYYNNTGGMSVPGLWWKL